MWTTHIVDAFSWHFHVAGRFQVGMLTLAGSFSISPMQNADLFLAAAHLVHRAGRRKEVVIALNAGDSPTTKESAGEESLAGSIGTGFHRAVGGDHSKEGIPGEWGAVGSLHRAEVGGHILSKSWSFEIGIVIHLLNYWIIFFLFFIY
jgi:hypothetical protein